MKSFRLLSLGLLAAALAALPSTTQAASYRHYVSNALHFSIDYPTTWTADYSSSQRYVSFNQSKSTALTINYHPAAGLTIKLFTNALITEYHKLRFHVGAPKYSGDAAAFTGTGTLAGYNVEVKIATLIDSHGAFSLTVAAPPAQFTKLTPIFKHMVNSFNTR